MKVIFIFLSSGLPDWARLSLPEVYVDTISRLSKSILSWGPSVVAEPQAEEEYLLYP